MKKSYFLDVLAILACCVSSLIAADNVILFIGDGMGPDHVKAGRVLVNGSSAAPLSFEALGNTAQSITILPNGTITDSATAGTALATGYQHPANGIISMGANLSIKTTILELAKAKGFRTGIITTDDIGGATPGAFGAHEPDRNLMADIRYDYLLEDTTYKHPASLPNILLGGGYDDHAIVPGTAYTYAGLAGYLGYSYVSTATELGSAFGQPLLGLFGISWAPMTAMSYRPVGTTEPRLSEMLTKALSMLENGQGLFLIAESANIDKLSHNNDRNFVYEVSELDAAVRVVVAWKNSHPSDNTLILLTADHETGGLSVPDQTLPLGTVPSMTFSSTGHSAKNVPVFATWPSSLNGLTIDNTEVFFLLEDYLNIATGGKLPEITGVAALGITETSATVQWDTVEPSSTALYNGSFLITSDPTRVTRHTVPLGGLAPDTQYQYTAVSTDIAGYSGSAVVSFTTKLDYKARVLAEPVVSVGTVSGTIAGVAATGDGLTQNVTEAASGAGSRMAVEYTLHTTLSSASIETLTLRGTVGWTGKDGTVDNLITEVRVPLPGGGYGWQRITLPFAANPASSYVNANGDIYLRFSDSASIRRERKDTLTVDYLCGEVIRGDTPPQLPGQPGTPKASDSTTTTVNLSWADSDSETKYLIWRYTTDGGWIVVAELTTGTTTFTDTGLTPGTAYRYVVRALNADGYADSIPVDVRTLDGLLAPLNLKAAAAKGAIKITWTDPNTTEDGYEVLRGTTPDGNFGSIATLEASTVSYSDQNVVRGTTYYYQVRVFNDSGIGPVSATVSATAR